MLQSSVMDRQSFYITTSIPYLNAKPHLGFALEAVQTDVIARFWRGQKKDVFFLSGADEHGAKIARAAESAGRNPKDFVDENARHFQFLLRELNVSNDDFIRTTDKKQHWPGVQKLWQLLKDNNAIYKDIYKGFYCEGCEAFITEKDLSGGLCRVHKKPPEVIEEENYFFRLSEFKDKIKKAIESGEFNILPEWRKSEISNMLDGIGDISFSRPSKDIDWGIPVPDDESQTIYVWGDALPNYITGLGWGSDNDKLFEKYWPADAHVIGKDIIKFHAIFWPAMLLSAGLPLPKKLFVHGFIHVGGEKMSKSVGNVVDPFPLIKKYGADAVRFYLLNEVPTFSDGEYSHKHFHEVYEGSLVHGLGNLVSRTATMIHALPGGSVFHRPEEELGRFPFRKKFMIDKRNDSIQLETQTPYAVLRGVVEPRVLEELQKFNIGEALGVLWAFIKSLDEYITDHEPYKKAKENPEEAAAILWNIASSLFEVSFLLEPFLPETSENIRKTFGINSDVSSQLPEKFVVASKPSHIFPKLDE
jgi:methionyl-tRNA synthetase